MGYLCILLYRIAHNIFNFTLSKTSLFPLYLFGGICVGVRHHLRCIHSKHNQIPATIFGGDIDHYVCNLALWSTYFVSAARVKISSTEYGCLIHDFFWILDCETIVEQVLPGDEVEQPLLPPTRLPVTSFDLIARMVPSSKAGIVKLAGRDQEKRCREIVIVDVQKREFTMTLGEEFGEVEGGMIHDVRERDGAFSVILSRNIGISGHQGFTLSTRYNSTILIDPPYSQAMGLSKWLEKAALKNYASDGISDTATSYTIVPEAAQIVPLSEVSAISVAGSFFVEVGIDIRNELDTFCVLECSRCRKKRRTRDMREFRCATYARVMKLVLR